jgi:hypothetical protein
LLHLLRLLQKKMPAITFVNGFWRELADFADRHATVEVLRQIAISNGINQDQMLGEFFREVAASCGLIQTMAAPRPLTARLLAWVL